MSTLTTLAVVGVCLWLGIYLARKMVDSNHALLGAIPHLSIVGLVAMALTIDHDSILFTGACIITATLCATIWSQYWQEERSNSNKKARRLQEPSANFSFGPEDDPFRRNDAGFFSPSSGQPSSSSGGRITQKQIGYRQSFTTVAPGIRRTKTGVIVKLIVFNRVYLVSKRSVKPDLRLV